MSFSDASKIILVGTETVYGTDAAPTVTDAIQTQGLRAQPFQGDTEQVDLDRAEFGAETTYHVTLHDTISFRVPLTGGGAAGTVPPWGKLLKACGFAETINAATDVIYNPISVDPDSVTIHYYRGGLGGNWRVMRGARGNARFMLDSRGLPWIEFTFTCLFSVPVNAASLPAADFSAWQTPVPRNFAHSPTFTLHGQAVAPVAHNIDVGNQVIHRDLPGVSPVVEISDRSITGTVNIIEPKVATFDFYTRMQNHTKGAYQMIHGTTAGNIVQLDAPAVQLMSPSEGEDNRIGTLSMNMAFIPDAGNDDLTVTVK